MTSLIYPFFLTGIALLCVWVVLTINMSKKRDQAERNAIRQSLKDWNLK